MSILEVALRPLIARAVHRVWREQCPTGTESSLASAQVKRVLAAGWQHYTTLRSSIPRGRSLGNRHVLLLSGVTLAFFRALMDEGLERQASVAVASLAVWELLRPVADLAWVAARLRTRERLKQVRFMMLLSLRYPFCPPGFVAQADPSTTAVKVDFHSCLAATYLCSQEAADLCLGAWCQQDYRLAERWGLELLRSGTRAGGADRCDFRFLLREPRPAASESQR